MNKTLFLISIILAAAICGIDQLHKWYMIVPYAIAQKSPVPITSFFNLVMVWNEGMSFGMLNNVAGSRWILATSSTLICSALLWWLYKTNNTLEAYALGFVIGGAVGNIIDRFNYGAVADFFDFYYQTYHFPAFNIADSAICAGALLLAFHSLRNGSKNDRDNS